MGNLDYLQVLLALTDIPFGVGKKLLIEFLQGKCTAESIVRNKIDKKDSFGSLAYDDSEIEEIIDTLSMNGFITQVEVKGKRFVKVYEITLKGRAEIVNPNFDQSANEAMTFAVKTKITDEDRILFDAFGDFLKGYNDEQKKAIVCNAREILCIAGAGSGKTTVLTKRIEMLVKYRSVDPRTVLAITFTRRARQEMQNRLSEIGGLDGVRVETFNSFCEKVLRRHEGLVYGRPVRVMEYKDRFTIMSRALSVLGLNMGQVLAEYFTLTQRKGKTNEQLGAIFMNDCFFVRDYFKFKNKKLDISDFDVESKHKRSAEIVFSVCNFIDAFMSKNGLRDFADQLMDAIYLFEKHPELIPEFEHILIDEYQDVNSTQIKFVDLLNGKNLFCVGDPRQAIYGWRGSDVDYILNFNGKYPDCAVVNLTTNYRSGTKIVELINSAISKMKLADLESGADGGGVISLKKFKNEDEEFDFIVKSIIKSDLPKGEIFVLARTNRQLNDFSALLKKHNISHIVRSDEFKRNVTAGIGDVTLATVHAIKGLEAELVFVIGCNSLNFPCKGSEHPIIEMVKVDEYEKSEEERRVFYVALSRAKSELIMTYCGRKPTYFLSAEMLGMLKSNVSVERSDNLDLYEKLKEWRRNVAIAMGVPAFLIMHDKTLIELSQKVPMCKDDLYDISGIGPEKVMKYGDDLLNVLTL